MIKQNLKKIWEKSCVGRNAVGTAHTLLRILYVAQTSVNLYYVPKTVNSHTEKLAKFWMHRSRHNI